MSGKVKRRGPGRPKGSRDSRQIVHDIIERKYRTAVAAIDEFNKLLAKMSPKEQMDAHLRLLELGVRASPKEFENQGVQVNLIIGGGLRPKVQQVQGEVVSSPALGDVVEVPVSSPPSLPAMRDDPDAPRGGKAREYCEGVSRKGPKQPVEEAPLSPAPRPGGPIVRMINGDWVTCDQNGVPLEATEDWLKPWPEK